MATTPNVGIVYPVVGNTITPLATHFANLANSVDTAVVAERSSQGYLVGTDAQRTAIISPILRKGLKYYATDTNKDWFYNGTTWISLDTGWVRMGDAGAVLTYASGWSNYVAGGWNGVYYRITNGNLLITGASAKSSWIAGDAVINVPSNLRPPFKLQGYKAQYNPVTFAVMMDGAGSSAESWNISWPVGIV